MPELVVLGAISGYRCIQGPSVPFEQFLSAHLYVYTGDNGVALPLRTSLQATDVRRVCFYRPGTQLEIIRPVHSLHPCNLGCVCHGLIGLCSSVSTVPKRNNNKHRVRILGYRYRCVVPKSSFKPRNGDRHKVGAVIHDLYFWTFRKITPLKKKEVTSCACQQTQIFIEVPTQDLDLTSTYGVLGKPRVGSQVRVSKKNKRILFFETMSWLGQIRSHRRDESWSDSL